MATPTLVLASSSPRRRELLARIGVTPDRIASPDIDETPRQGELPRIYAVRMAEEKARAVTRGENEIVIAGDTTVAPGRRILQQAEDAAMNAGFLRLLSGRRHRVLSAVSVISAGGVQRTRLSETSVKFKVLHEDEIAAYVATGEGIGKAGGYAIQGAAEGLISWVQGSYSAVVGLPLFETRALLKAAGLTIA